MTLHKYEGALLPNIWLNSGFTHRETKWGSGTSYIDLDGLFRAITLTLAQSSYQLDGAAVRFLRKRLDMTQAELGAELGYTDQAIAQWEKSERPVPTGAARLIKAFALRQIAPHMPIADALLPHEAAMPAQLVFGHTLLTGWTCTLAPKQTAPITATHAELKSIPAFLESGYAHAGRFNPAMINAFANNDKHFDRHESKLAAARV